MTVDELRAQYVEALRARLKELVAEKERIEAELGESPPTTNKWTPERRAAHSRRMKRMHREGKFRR